MAGGKGNFAKASSMRREIESENPEF